ncbi:uncharacterized protein PHALS_11530 [Plasmopara halstedii]|uniref:Uncharacterized protein n=1 Tax=Plasmopara halstedii TaxID=4781 RepID=A0A0P1A5M3_PLAHL|nr:uncharacterized protein PHALS_11530 [Plasmopara halstedii]CEG35662.1 hypothetical protein PHALS_11530 [Plasmopara halstedii]|eukprot:XP_024572031.1 hypothetical protein PHALS_11530 [Plasmopara halstedii]
MKRLLRSENGRRFTYVTDQSKKSLLRFILQISFQCPSLLFRTMQSYQVHLLVVTLLLSIVELALSDILRTEAHEEERMPNWLAGVQTRSSSGHEQAVQKIGGIMEKHLGEGNFKDADFYKKFLEAVTTDSSFISRFKKHSWPFQGKHARRINFDALVKLFGIDRARQVFFSAVDEWSNQQQLDDGNQLMSL